MFRSFNGSRMVGGSLQPIGCKVLRANLRSRGFGISSRLSERERSGGNGHVELIRCLPAFAMSRPVVLKDVPAACPIVARFLPAEKGPAGGERFESAVGQPFGGPFFFRRSGADDTRSAISPHLERCAPAGAAPDLHRFEHKRNLADIPLRRRPFRTRQLNAARPANSKIGRGTTGNAVVKRSKFPANSDFSVCSRAIRTTRWAAGRDANTAAVSQSDFLTLVSTARY